jgi:hypothetical protein
MCIQQHNIYHTGNLTSPLEPDSFFIKTPVIDTRNNATRKHFVTNRIFHYFYMFYKMPDTLCGNGFYTFERYYTFSCKSYIL